VYHEWKVPHRTRRPSPPLDRYIQTLWTWDSFVQAHAKERLLPDGSLQLVVNLREDQTRTYDRENLDRCHTYSGAILAGAHSSYFVIDTAEQASVAGVHFLPGGAFPFLGLPADELQDRHVSLELLWGGLAGELRERLLAAPNPDARLVVMEQVLLARLRGPRERHPAVTWAISEFAQAPRPVQHVLGEIGLSERRFIELFRRQVGLAPKRYCSVVRFQHVLRRLQSGHEVDWARVAQDCGYFDQPHFIHDFRRFSGLNPTAYAPTYPRHPNHVPIR